MSVSRGRRGRVPNDAAAVVEHGVYERAPRSQNPHQSDCAAVAGDGLDENTSLDFPTWE